MIRAGPMRHVVTIQVRSTEQDAAGEPVDVWTTFATRRAAVERTPGRELVASAQRQGRVPTIFRLRFLAGVMPAMRIVHGGKVHEITSAIDQEGRGEELIITAEEIVEGSP